MLERSRNTHRISSLKTVAAFLLAFTCFFVVGCGYVNVGKLENYDSFLRDYTKYSKYPVGPSAPIIDGFELITDIAFDFGKVFGNGAAFVKKGEKNYVLSRSGELCEIENDLTDVALYGDKYVIECDGKFAVFDIFGNSLLDDKYDRVEIKDNTILTLSGKKVEIYIDGEPVSYRYFESETQVHLINGLYVYYNGDILGCDLVKKEICGYPYVNIPSENKVIVTMPNGYIGYADIIRGEMIGKSYVSANNFRNGVATATTEAGMCEVIDTDGNVLYESKDKIIGDKYGKYHCYLKHNMYGVLNERYEDITGNVFSKIKYEKAVGDYIIVDHGSKDRIFSLIDGEFTDVMYDEIRYANGMFFCLGNGKTIIKNETLYTVGECDSYIFDGDILIVESDGLFRYYAKLK